MKKQITILIADDNQLMRETLRILIFSMENTQLVGEAENGEQAIELAGQLLPDIILMDINMSPVNGFEATRKILKQNPGIKIIGLSMHNQSSYTKNMIQSGARGYITKIASHHKIIEAINKVAAGGRYFDKDIEGMV